MRFTRTLFSDNSIISDWSTQTNKYQSGNNTFSFTAAEDYLYIGNIAAFNHFYLKMSTPSVASTTMTVEHFSGTSNAWERVADLIDETNGLTSSGFVSFVPMKDEQWNSSDCIYDAAGNVSFNNSRNAIDANDSVIYDKYWLRISFNNDLTASSVIDWVGQKFCDDDDIGSEFPSLLSSNFLTGFEPGKTSWEEQSVRASELIVKQLISKQVLTSKNQLLERSTLTLACVSKTAEIIYNAFGDDYIDQKHAARKEYDQRLSASIYDIDSNNDGDLDLPEMARRQGFLSR